MTMDRAPSGGGVRCVVTEADILDAFEKASEEIKELVVVLVSHFHIRDGYKNDDGSLGRVIISPKQLRDCLAYMAASRLLGTLRRSQEGEP